MLVNDWIQLGILLTSIALVVAAFRKNRTLEALVQRQAEKLAKYQSTVDATEAIKVVASEVTAFNEVETILMNFVGVFQPGVLLEARDYVKDKNLFELDDGIQPHYGSLAGLIEKVEQVEGIIRDFRRRGDQDLEYHRADLMQKTVDLLYAMREHLKAGEGPFKSSSSKTSKRWAWAIRDYRDALSELQDKRLEKIGAVRAVDMAGDRMLRRGLEEMNMRKEMYRVGEINTGFGDTK